MFLVRRKKRELLRPKRRGSAAGRTADWNACSNNWAARTCSLIDVLGYVPFTKAGSELLFEVVSRAYERKSLILATNLAFEQWVEVCGSERLTGAMLDRLTHRVPIVEANGESYRLRDSQQRIRRKRAERTET